LLIERGEVSGEPPEDPLVLFSVLYGFWAANYLAFDGDVLRKLAMQFLALAEKQGATGPIMIGHRLMGTSLLLTGDLVEGLTHLNRGMALCDPMQHRSLATRFGQDVGVAILCYRALALWLRGYPDAALADAEQALQEARKIGQAVTLAYAIVHVNFLHRCRGNYTMANAIVGELAALADERGSSYWKSQVMVHQGCIWALTGKAADAVNILTAGLASFSSTGATCWNTQSLADLTIAFAELGRFDDAWRCIGETTTIMEKTGERWWEAETNRVAGEITLLSPEPDATNAEAFFERALAVARQQQAKSWELRAAMSLARLWRDQGKVQQAHELLAPVYGWFTEGFDTRDLKEAKALLEELS
jgi:predicted ATPase